MTKMTIKEIKYNGFTETPSDYECPDGDLATVSGLVPEDEALRPVQKAKPYLILPQFSKIEYPDDFYNVVYVHENPGYKHYIIQYHHVERDSETHAITGINDYFYWTTLNDNGSIKTLNAEAFRDQTGVKLIVSFDGDVEHGNEPRCNIYELNSVGNTLLILTDIGTYYFLWKGISGTLLSGYVNLGTQMPEPKLSFGLQGAADKTQETWTFEMPKSVRDAEADAQGGSIDYDNCTFITDDYINTVTDAVMAKVNAFVAKKSVEEGKFIFPFMVRYAYRLMDESLIMHSCPVLMMTDTFCSPHVFRGDGTINLTTGIISWKTKLGAMLYDLDYKKEFTSTELEKLDDWKDIIKSIDIFISEPIYTYNQSGKIKGCNRKENNERGYGVFKIPAQDSTYVAISNTSAYSKYYTSLLVTRAEADYDRRDEYLLDTYSESEMQQKISDVHSFYLLKSIPINELANSRTVIELPDNLLANLTGRELMNDDYQSHDLLIPRYSFTYNSRNNIANIQRKLLNPFAPNIMLCHSDYSQTDQYQDAPILSANYRIYIFIRENNKEMVIEGGLSLLEYQNPFICLYYPNPNAYKAVIKKQYNSTTEYYELPLKRHDFLNGAVYFDGWNPSPTMLQQEPTTTSDNTVELPNKIYTSEVDNPFLFTAKGINTLGVGTILGMRPAVKAMSPSQYGQFKYYVFTTDGVWALEVSSSGYLQYPSIVTPDVVNGAGESITQIDGAVIFATNRGIMMVTGSQSICMSDILNSKQPFVPFATAAANDLLPGLRNIVPADIPLASLEPIHFLSYIADCKMVYDYTHQHILVFNPAQPYAYVYSLKSKLWGMIPSNMRKPVLDYPSAMVMVEASTTEGYTRLMMSDYAYNAIPDPSLDDTVYKGLIITRPLKLDMPDVLKTVPTVIQRGMFEKGHVYGALYGSRDLLHWQLVWSSIDHYIRGQHGTPYKYFRLALVCDLTSKESLFGCSMGVIPRDTNNLR